ncbi:MAG: Hint domain-containing homing endonuclease [Candidatus Helarchaeota archaeon]
MTFETFIEKQLQNQKQYTQEELKELLSSKPTQNSPTEVVIKNGQFDINKIVEYQGKTIKKFEFRPQKWCQFIGQKEAKERAKTIIKKIEKGLKSHFLIDGIKGHGKCHAKGTKILMYDGSLKNVEDIKINDKVMGVDSKPRNVKNIGTGFGTLYKIIPSKGTSFVVNGEHVLSLKKTGTEEILNISVNEYLKSKTTITQMYELYRVPVNFKEQKLPLEPYFLGLWLGDGSSTDGRITNIDKKIWGYLKTYAKKLKLNFHNIKHKNKANTISLTSLKGQCTKNCLRKQLRKLNVLQNKHIPNIYKINSRENRLQLLAGLIDSDGWLNKPSTYEIVTKFDELAKDIEYLAGTLGFLVNKRPKYVQMKQWTKPRHYWRISIIGDCSQIPVKLDRKKCAKRIINKDPLKTGFKVKKLKKGKFYGFTLNGDHLYMIENFIVNHNTTFVELLAKDVNAHLIKRIGKQINVDNLVDIVNEINTSTKDIIIFFVDEIDTADWKLIKVLNPIIESFEIAGKHIKPFVFVGATINKHKLIEKNPDTLDRIPTHIKFKRYNDNEIQQILNQYVNQLYSNENIDEQAIVLISQNCKFNPRTSIALLEEYVVEKNMEKVLKNCNVIKNGLNHIDIKILNVLNSSKKAMGCNALAQKCGLSQKEYTSEFEPFLVEYGYINRVPSRIITEKGIKLLKTL